MVLRVVIDKFDESGLIQRQMPSLVSFLGGVMVKGMARHWAKSVVGLFELFNVN